MLVTADGAPSARDEGAWSVPVRALRFPTKTREGGPPSCRSRPVQGAAAGVRPHGGDRLEHARAAAVRHDRRHPERGPAQRHAARSTSAASGRSPAPATSTAIRRRGRCRPARRRCAASPPAAGRAGARAAELDAKYGPQSRSRKRRCTAWCSGSRTRSTPRTCARPAAATPVMTSTSGAPDHVLVEQLRNKGGIIFAKAVLTPRTTAAPATRRPPQARRRCCRRRSAFSAAPGRQSVQRL